MKNNLENKMIIIILFIFFIISIISIEFARIYTSPALGNLVIKQIIWYILGFSLIFISLKIKKKDFYKLTWILYFLNLLLLLLVLFFGKVINGSRCWFNIPGIGSLQPSEFMKIVLILVLANTIGNYISKNKKPKTKDELLLLIKILLIILPPIVLTFLEPDTGAVLIYIVITIFMLFCSNIKKRWFIIGLIICGIIILSFLYLYFYKQKIFVDIFGTKLFYRMDRLLDWKNGTGIQLENSLASIGSSGLFSHGKVPIYFPEVSTDFIFSVIISCGGLISGILLLLLIVIFDINLLNIAKKTKDNKNKLLIIGTTAMLIYQQIQNISMTLGLLPITGITLPFISYGGSSLLSYFIMISIIIFINKKEKVLFT